MTVDHVDHKAIREALEKAKGHVHGFGYLNVPAYMAKCYVEENAIEWIRQLLDENERLRMENKTIRDKQIRQLGLPMSDLCERIMCENEQLKADKAAAVEALKQIAGDQKWPPLQSEYIARTALERLEGGEKV